MLPELFGDEGQKGAAVGVGVEVVAGVVGVEDGGTAVAGGKFEAHHQMVAMENIHLGEAVLGGRVVAGGDGVACVGQWPRGRANHVWLLQSSLPRGSQSKNCHLMPSFFEVCFVQTHHPRHPIEYGVVTRGDETDFHISG